MLAMTFPTKAGDLACDENGNYSTFLSGPSWRSPDASGINCFLSSLPTAWICGFSVSEVNIKSTAEKLRPRAQVSPAIQAYGRKSATRDNHSLRAQALPHGNLSPDSSPWLLVLVRPRANLRLGRNGKLLLSRCRIQGVNVDTRQDFVL
jgi:hypothetical protein